jgi:hypothetical protein
MNCSHDNCKAYALKGNDPPFCFLHHPDKREAITAMRIKGGKNSRRASIPLPQTLQDVERTLAEITRAVLEGRISAKASEVCLRCCEALIRIREDQELANRISAIEEKK